MGYVLRIIFTAMMVIHGFSLKYPFIYMISLAGLAGYYSF